MTSDRKIAANRRNAKKSTGPRTEAGRRRSRLNAMRHGLAVAIGSQPAYSDDVNSLAKALSGVDRPINEFARQVAEAEIDLLRIRQNRASQINDVLSTLCAPPEAYAELNRNLAKLARYERRAHSRRKRALQALIM